MERIQQLQSSGSVNNNFRGLTAENEPRRKELKKSESKKPPVTKISNKGVFGQERIINIIFKPHARFGSKQKKSIVTRKCPEHNEENKE